MKDYQIRIHIIGLSKKKANVFVGALISFIGIFLPVGTFVVELEKE